LAAEEALDHPQDHPHDDAAPVTAADLMGSEQAAAEEAEESKPKDGEINVVLVADIDMLHRQFFMLREQGANPERGLDFNFDNVTFVLNVLDMLAGDDRFVEIRNRRPKHRTLTRVDDRVAEFGKETAQIREELQEEFSQTQDELQKGLDQKMQELREDMTKKNLDMLEIARRIALATNDAQRRNDVQIERLRQKQDRQIKEAETKQAADIRRVQDTYKMWAVVLPPIPPLLVALGVFLTRRAREKEGVARSRLR